MAILTVRTWKVDNTELTHCLLEPGGPCVKPMEPGGPCVKPMEPGGPCVKPMEPGGPCVKPMGPIQFSSQWVKNMGSKVKLHI